MIETIKRISKPKEFVLFSTIATVLLFVVSFFLGEWADLAVKIISIAYLIFFIIFLLFRTEKVSVRRVGEKRKRTKKFTGSTYRKIFHRKECRFADSIKDQYFIENDEKNFFLKKGYKPCKICMSKHVDSSELKSNRG